MPSVSPFLWFPDHAAEAAAFYVALFPNSRILESNPLVTTFELDGQRVQAMSGARTPPTEAFSFQVEVEDQGELDRYWNALADGGEESMCGWLKDRFGLSWQIVPRGLGDLIGGPDPEGAARAMQAMLGMRRLDIASLQAAYAGD